MDMTRDCLKSERPFGVCLIRNGKEVGTAAEPEAVGCLAHITSWDMEQLGAAAAAHARRAAVSHPRVERRAPGPAPRARGADRRRGGCRVAGAVRRARRPHPDGGRRQQRGAVRRAARVRERVVGRLPPERNPEGAARRQAEAARARGRAHRASRSCTASSNNAAWSAEAEPPGTARLPVDRVPHSILARHPASSRHPLGALRPLRFVERFPAHGALRCSGVCTQRAQQLPHRHRHRGADRLLQRQPQHARLGSARRDALHAADDRLDVEREVREPMPERRRAARRSRPRSRRGAGRPALHRRWTRSPGSTTARSRRPLRAAFRSSTSPPCGAARASLYAGAGRRAAAAARATRRRGLARAPHSLRAPGSGRTAGARVVHTRRTEIHEPLDVGLDVGRRQQRLGELPQPLLDRALARESPSIAKCRASTRFTLPSRIAARAPYANPAIAAAVERPIPGSASMSASSRGKAPACCSTIACAAR